MIKRKWIFSLTLSIALLWTGIFAAVIWGQHVLNGNRRARPVVTPGPVGSPDLKIYWPMPAFSFHDQNGNVITQLNLAGHVCIVDFIYTQCTSACPMMTSKMVLVQKQLPSPEVRFVSFSVDPEHDTQAALKDYEKLWEGDSARWRLVQTDPAGLKNLVAGMHVTAESTDDKNNPILHSDIFFLVDQAGRVRGLYDSGDDDAMRQLVSDVQTLDGKQVPATNGRGFTDASAVVRGQVLFGSMGCLACHSQPRVAPPLQSVYGSIVRLDDKKMVWADDAYLHESIVDPTAKIVSGYMRSMPNYRSVLDDQQVMDLVSYIKSLSTNQPGGHGTFAGAATSQPADDELLTDPVCKMQVKRDPATPHLDFNGKTFYFCSDHCKEQFQKNPKDYALTKPAAQ